MPEFTPDHPTVPQPVTGRAMPSILAAGFLLLIFACLAGAVVAGVTTSFDEAVLRALRTQGDPTNPIGPPWLEEMGRDVTAMGSLSILFFLSLAFAGYWLLTSQRGFALRIIVALAGAELLSTSLKSLFDRPRPEVSQLVRVFTAGFPSGHALLSSAVFLTLGAILAQSALEPHVKRYVLAIAVFMTFIVGLSRLYLGVHYPSDVLAGWCLGTAWALLCGAGSEWLERRSSRT